MYHEYYNLSSDPFRLSPDNRFCQRHPGFAKAKAYMQFAVERGEGFVMITGRPGTGKTTLIDDVLADLGREEFLCAHLVSAQLEAEDLLRMVAFNLGMPVRSGDKAGLLAEMQRFLAEQVAGGRRVLLVVDEAQGLSLEALEELRLLTNMQVGDRPMLQIFLVGQDGLRERIQDPSMEQLHQRLIATCHLEPLDFKQSAAYVLHRFKVAGWNGRPKLRAHVFPALYRFSHGIPRRINLFMGRLLLQGWLEEKEELSEADAQEVWEDLRQEQLVSTWETGEAHVDASLAELDAMAREASAPDQTIGAKLLEQERRQPANPFASPVPAGARPAEPAAQRPQPAGVEGRPMQPQAPEADRQQRMPVEERQPEGPAEERMPSMTATREDDFDEDDEEYWDEEEKPRRKGKGKGGLGGFFKRFFLSAD